MCEHRQSRNELDVLSHLARVGTRRSGSHLVRTVLNSFQVATEHHVHQCLILHPLDLTLSDLGRLYDGKVPEEIMKAISNYLLLALDFLHTEARVVHTGMVHITPDLSFVFLVLE